MGTSSTEAPPQPKSTAAQTSQILIILNMDDELAKELDFICGNEKAGSTNGSSQSNNNRPYTALMSTNCEYIRVSA